MTALTFWPGANVRPTSLCQDSIRAELGKCKRGARECVWVGGGGTRRKSLEISAICIIAISSLMTQRRTDHYRLPQPGPAAVTISHYGRGGSCKQITYFHHSFPLLSIHSSYHSQSLPSTAATLCPCQYAAIERRLTRARAKGWAGGYLHRDPLRR